MIFVDKYGIVRNSERKFGIEVRVRYNGTMTNWYPFRTYKTEGSFYNALKNLKENQKKHFYGTDVEYRPYYVYYQIPDPNMRVPIVYVPRVMPTVQQRHLLWKIKLKQLQSKNWVKTLFFSFS